MKKTLLILFFLFTASYSFGQNKWSIQLSTLTGGFSDNWNRTQYSQATLSYSVQLSGYYNLHKGLKIGAGVGYLMNRSGYKFTVTPIDELDPVWPNEITVKIKYAYLTVPLKVKYDFNLSDKFYIPAEVNGIFNFNISNKSASSTNNSWRSFDMDTYHPVITSGLSTGLGYRLNEKMKLEVALDYSIYLTPIGKGYYSKASNYYIPALKGKNTVWGGLNLSYNF